jgi:hypothetical protein
MKTHELAIPYRLKTPEDVSEAIRLNLIPEGWDDCCILDLARRILMCEHLRDALAEMFADVDYRYLLVPLRISNHEAVQRVFNQYRKKLPPKEFHFQTPYAEHFESLGGRYRYSVFAEVV